MDNKFIPAKDDVWQIESISSDGKTCVIKCGNVTCKDVPLVELRKVQVS